MHRCSLLILALSRGSPPQGPYSDKDDFGDEVSNPSSHAFPIFLLQPARRQTP